MDSTSHPYVIDADASGTPSDTAEMLVGTAVEYGLDPKVDIQRITRPEPGFRITEALAEALGSDMDTEPDTVTGDPLASYDEDGFPLDGGPYGRDKPEDWLTLSDLGKQAYVYSEPVQPDLSGNKQSLAPEHDIDGTPTETAYEDWEYQDLKSAVKTRGIETPDLKTDTLVAALKADDLAQAEGEEGDTTSETE